MEDQPRFNRDQLGQAVQGVAYPAERDALVRQAQKNGATEELCDMLGKLPEVPYTSEDGVFEASKRPRDE